MQLVQHFRCISADVLSQTVLLVQSGQYILLHIPDHLRLSQIIQTQLPEAGEHLRDAFRLFPRGAHQQQPLGKQVVVVGEQFGDCFRLRSPFARFRPRQRRIRIDEAVFVDGVD